MKRKIPKDLGEPHPARAHIITINIEMTGRFYRGEKYRKGFAVGRDGDRDNPKIFKTKPAALKCAFSMRGITDVIVHNENAEIEAWWTKKQLSDTF